MYINCAYIYKKKIISTREVFQKMPFLQTVFQKVVQKVKFAENFSLTLK